MTPCSLVDGYRRFRATCSHSHCPASLRSDIPEQARDFSVAQSIQTWSAFPAAVKRPWGGGTFGWGTALQDGRSRVRFPMSLEFLIDIIRPAALWPLGRLSLKRKWVLGIFPGGKGGRWVGLTTFKTNKLRGLSPHANYTDRVAAAGRRS